MYKRPLVPDGFAVPEGFATADLVARMLTVHDVVRDFDAVMSSADRLVGHMDRSGWPRGLTLEENLIDLAWHQREFTIRHSFAYTVTSPDGGVCLGCCYIYPPADPAFDADAFYWVRTSALAAGLEDRLGQAFRRFLAERWPFRRVAFPGRDQPLPA